MPAPVAPAAPVLPAALAPHLVAGKPPPRSAEVRVVTAQHSSLIGGRYQIVKRIGQGGMGKVYEVNHIHLSRRFALKIISNQVAETDEARELFYREARFASAMAHPNITSVVDFGEDEKVGMFMVMEFVSGEPLNRVLFREKRMGVKKACGNRAAGRRGAALHPQAERRPLRHQDREHPDRRGRSSRASARAWSPSCSTSGSRDRWSARAPRRRCRARLTTSHPSASAASRRRRRATSTASASCCTSCSAARCHGMARCRRSWAATSTSSPGLRRSIVEGLDPAVENLVLHALAKTPAERHKDMAAFIYELRTVMDMLGYGKRRGAVTGRRVVIEKPENRRDELARLAFDSCRLPLALLEAHGQIVAANPAFAKFVMGVAVEVEGLPVKSTRARDRVGDGRARHPTHARRQPGAARDRDRRQRERDPSPAAVARRGVEGSGRARRAAARPVETFGPAVVLGSPPCCGAPCCRCSPRSR